MYDSENSLVVNTNDNDIVKKKGQKSNKEDNTEDFVNNVKLIDNTEKKISNSETSDVSEPQSEKIGMSNPNQITEITANLWKYHNVPDNEPESFPEYITCYEKYDASEIVGARVRGKKHKHEGSNCDDWFEIGASGSITFIAVSDGAGSKKYSRIGAKSACKAAVGYMKMIFDDLHHSDSDFLSSLSLPADDEKCTANYKKIAGIVHESMNVAYRAVESSLYKRYADKRYSDVIKRDIMLSDFSTTLLIAVCIPLLTNEKEKIVISCQIGDGAIVLIDTKGYFDDSVKLMGEADSGDFSGETDFLVSGKLLDSANLASRTRVSRSFSDIIMLMTDGVADDYFPNETQMHRLYFDLVANGILEETESFSTADLSSSQIEIIKNIPQPIEYPWVNDKSISIGLNYTNEIMSTLNMSLQEIWNNKYIMSIASAKVKEMMNTLDKSERLKIWLDNYVERGSFDDRTLVVARI